MRLLATGTLCFAALTSPLAAQRWFPSDSVVEALARRVVEPRGDVGVVVGLLEPDGTRRVVAVGNRPYDGRTLFEIGSITKVFTGVLVAEMAARGEVRVDQPVSELFPDSVSIPARGGRQVRLVDLATHSSGLPRMPTNFQPADPRNPFADYSYSRLYDFLRNHELERDVGGTALYSNIGFGLLGHALEVRAGMPYEALVTERILEPLRMSSTMMTIPDSARSRLAPGHNASGEPVSSWDIPTLAGAGALRSTAEDMLTFLAASLAPKDSTPLGRAMWRARLPHFGRTTISATGLGWAIDTRYDRTIIWHNGGTGGYRAFAGIDPDRRTGVVVLSNQARSADPIGMHLLDPRRPLSTAGLRQGFVAMAATLGVLLVAGVYVAWRRTGGSRRRALGVAALTAVGVLLWMGITGATASLGMLHFGGTPPTMVLLLLALFALAIGLGVSPIGRRLAMGLPLAVLVGVQGFRLPLELLMHRAYEYRIMPEQMSYSGLNFDIVTGSLAIVVAVLIAIGRAGTRAARVWNAIGAVLLLNIILIALLSAPTPLRVFRNDPPNVWVTTFPYVWLPAVMVGVAILGHIVVFRRLRARRSTGEES